MKYIEEEVEPYILVGERLVIDGIESGIVLWHVDYFELKIVKAQKTQEEPLTFPPNA